MFVNGQLVQAADLNNFSVTTVTTSGAVVVGTTLSVTGAATLSSTASVTGTLSPLGLVDISGASAGQIKFPATQNASANANTLDDYEEGTWTPVIGGEGGTTGQAYSTQVGLYTKVGNRVRCQFVAVLSTLGTLTSNVIISGLPYTVGQGGTSLHCGSLIWFTTTSSYSNLQLLALAGTLTVRVYGIGAAGTSMVVLAQGDLANTTTFHGSFEYLV